MNGRTITSAWLPTASVLLICCGDSNAADSITVGDVVVDPPTICCLGFSIPIISGDDNYDAVAMIEYRENTTSIWSTGLPLLRVRPELTSKETPPSQYGLPRPSEQFAGSLFRLNPEHIIAVKIDGDVRNIGVMR